MSLRNSCRPSVVPSGLRSNGTPRRARLLGRAHDVQAPRGAWIDLLDQLDLAALEQAVQLLDVGFVEAKLGRGGRDLGVCEHAEPLTAGNQTLDLLKLPKLRY